MKPGFQMIIILAVFAISAFYCLHYFGGYEGLGDGNDYTALARNIANGNGLTINHVYPLALNFNSAIPQPDNIWAPGYPIYLTFWFTIFGADDKVSIWAAIVAVWILMAAAYLIARKIGGIEMGLLAAVLVGLSQFVLRIAIEGTPEILTAILLTFSIYILLRPQNLRHVIFSAAIFGLAILTRYQITLLAVPLIILFIEDKKRYLVPWIIVMLLSVTPWLIRNWLVLGNPFFTLQTYGEFTKGMGRFDDYYLTYRSFIPMTFWYALSHFPLSVAKKFIAGLFYFAKSFPSFFNFLGVVPFFYLFFKSGETRGIERKIFLFSLWGICLIVIPTSFAGAHDRHLLPLLVFLIITMLVGFRFLVRDFGINRNRLAFIIATALLFLPAKAPIQEKELAGIANKSRASMLAYGEIEKLVGNSEVVVSDVSDAIWWYSERSSIWIPVHFDDLNKLIDEQQINYLYLDNPDKYLGKFARSDRAQFADIVEPVTEFSGPGVLYKIRHEEKTPTKSI
jgi:4-amino-4-deoxy-L-arabinose transferase-like glycosyltransferase